MYTISYAMASPVISNSTRSSCELLEKRGSEEGLALNIAHTNETYKGRLTIQDTGSHGWGLYSERHWNVGDLVMRSRPINNIRHMKDAHTIQYDVDKHASIDLPARFVNHICGVANIGIQVIYGKDKKCAIGDKNVDDISFEFYAMKEIRMGEEILWDYETTEYDMLSKFECLCGSPVCRKKLTGFRDHSNNVLDAYGEKWVAPYILALLKK
jgi:uncharacterized protein